METVGSEFIGNNRAYTTLIEWLSTDIQQKGPKLCQACICLVAGGSGVGKTHGVKQAIESVAKNVRIVNKDECTNSKDFKEFLLKHTRSNVMEQFENVAKKETIIFIDDIETLLAVDRSFINNFNALLTASDIKAIRIITTCNISELKVITKNMMYDKLIQMDTPSVQSIECFLRSHATCICNVDNVVNTIVDEIAAECDGNISTALNMARMRIQDRDASRTRTSTQTEDTSHKLDYFPEVAKVYNISCRNQLRAIVEQDPWLHPLRFHENIIHEFKTRKGSKASKEQCYITILNGLCEWDQLMAHNKGNSQSVPIEHACSIMQLLTKFPRLKNAPPSMDEFTRMFNYLSLRKKNIINLYDGGFPWEMVGSSFKKENDARIRKEMKDVKSRIKKLSM